MVGRSRRSAADALPRPLPRPPATGAAGEVPARRVARLRRATLLLAALGGLALVVYLPFLRTAYQNWQLGRKSLAQLETIVRRDPNNVPARYRLGMAYARADRYYEAAREFRAVLDRDPVRPDVLNDLGVSYLLQERYGESLLAFRGALTARPNFAGAHANLGRLYLATKMPYTATRELQEAVRLDPQDVEAICDLGEAMQRTLNFKGSEEAYRRILRHHPRHVRAHVGLGRVLYAAGRYAEAEAALRKALTLAPRESTVLATLGRLRLERATSDAELREAEALLQRAVQADPGYADAWYDLGRISLREGQAAQAVEREARAWQLSPDHLGALHQLERALRAAGRKLEADRAAIIFKQRALREREETRLEERISRVPGDWDARARLAELYLQSGKQGKALLLYHQLKEGQPGHPRLPILTRLLNPHPGAPIPPGLLGDPE